MEPVFAIGPEFHPIGHDPETRPESRAGHLSPGKARGLDNHLFQQSRPAFKRFGLSGRPRPDSALQRARFELLVRLLVTDRRDPALDPDLPCERWPIETQRRLVILL